MVLNSEGGRPPRFHECYLCHREFGSKSIQIHESQCRAHWNRLQRINNSPRSRQYGGHKKDKTVPQKVKVNSNAHEAVVRVLGGRRKRPVLPLIRIESTMSEEGAPSSPARPQTATLDRPRILDVTLQPTLDMSLTKKDFLAGQSSLVKPFSEDEECLLVVGERPRGTSGYGSPWEDELRRQQTEDEEEEGSKEDEVVIVTPSNFPSDVQLRRKRLYKKTPSTTSQSGSSSSRSVASNASVNNNNNNKGKPRDKKIPIKKESPTINSVNNNNNNGSQKEDNSKKTSGSTPANVPAPCQSCGRAELPERLHSHPRRKAVQQSRPTAVQEENDKNARLSTSTSSGRKSSVQKPHAMKYKSGGGGSRGNVSSANSNENSAKKDSKPVRPTLVVNRKALSESGVTASGGGARCLVERLWAEGRLQMSPDEAFIIVDDRESPVHGPRTLTCFICGREFGTTSYPLHEPRCLEKWERENALLPVSLRRALPDKPVEPMTVDEWNEFAWRASQSQLVPCENCGRTFYPDRLEVHQRGCRPRPGQQQQVALQSPPQQQSASTSQGPSVNSGGKSGNAAPPPPRRPTVPCYVCHREFGFHSIHIHEPQCLSRWRVENDKLPESQRKPEPQRPSLSVLLEDEAKVVPAPVIMGVSPDGKATVQSDGISRPILPQSPVEEAYNLPSGSGQGRQQFPGPKLKPIFTFARVHTTRL